MGGVADVKTILRVVNHVEAFKRVFDSYTKGNEISTDVESGTEIAKVTSEDVKVMLLNKLIKQIQLIMLVIIVQ